MPIERFANNAQTTLSANISDSDLLLTVASAATFPSLPQFRILVESELMLVSTLAGTGNTQWTVTRGIEGTTASSHSTGISVLQIVTAGGLGNLTCYTDAQAQNAVGSILVDSAELDFTYDNLTPSITATLKTSGVSGGTYTKVTVDTKGRVTTGALLSAGDLPDHASRHQAGGADPIKLDDLAAPDDNTDLNTSSTKHGLAPKLDNDTTHFLNGQGGWTTPTGILDITGLTAVPPALADAVPLYHVAASANRKASLETMLGLLRGYIDGYILSNNGSDANNDIDIAAGVCADSTGVILLQRTSSLTKRLDASWAVGTNTGGLDTGSKATNTWYHVWVIQRSDTGVNDALFSTSATSPTMPSNYDYKRRIGSVLTDSSGNLRAFTQVGTTFLWNTILTDVDATNPGTSAVTRTLSTPAGVVVTALLGVSLTPAASGCTLFLSPLATTDSNPSYSLGVLTLIAVSGVITGGGEIHILTNTSSQIRSRLNVSDGSARITIGTRGWIDMRGKDL